MSMRVLAQLYFLHTILPTFREYHRVYWSSIERYTVHSSTMEGLKFLDEAETINKYIEKLESMGVKTIEVIIHDGGSHKII